LALGDPSGEGFGLMGARGEFRIKINGSIAPSLIVYGEAPLSKLGKNLPVSMGWCSVLKRSFVPSHHGETLSYLRVDPFEN
jgi:hypothetical protein